MVMEPFQDLSRLAAGFQGAKIFLVANDLDLFIHLQTVHDVDGLARILKVRPAALSVLLDALVALGLIEKADGGYRNGKLARDCLGSGPNYRGHIFKHLSHCWGAWDQLEKALREGNLITPPEKEILNDSERWNHVFINAMDDVTRDLAPKVAAQIDLAGVATMLDLGGGPGTYAAAFLARYPQLRVRLFDLPETLTIAREKVRQHGLGDRVELVAGDFMRDELGRGHDAIWISQVLHSLGEEGCRLLLEKARRALNPGGRILIHEFLLNDDKTSPLRPALFSVHMLVMTAAGRAYSGGEIARWLAAAGFDQIETRSVSEDTGLVAARKPY